MKGKISNYVALKVWKTGWILEVEEGGMVGTLYVRRASNSSERTCADRCKKILKKTDFPGVVGEYLGAIQKSLPPRFRGFQWCLAFEVLDIDSGYDISGLRDGVNVSGYYMPVPTPSRDQDS